MTADERAEKAVMLKHSGYNCAQAVLGACADLTDLDPAALRNISSGFGGGMGCMEATCGALAGAVMTAGLMQNGQGTLPKAAIILKDFQQRSGATICRELKGVGTGRVLCPCDDCVRNAIHALSDTVTLS